MHVPGFDPIGEIARNDWHVLYRALRRPDRAPVLLKVARDQPVHALSTMLLEREREMLRQISAPGLLAAVDLIRTSDGPCLVLEDPGGSGLSSGRPLGVAECLDIGVRLCRILQTVHRHDVIHRGVRPHGVLRAATGEICLWDSSRLTPSGGDTVGPIPQRLEPGELPYLSPEQTGRMNRAVDYRSDLYALGITLYELLTGAPPFRFADPLELVHAHIARVPIAPAAVDPSIPDALSDLVMKLLAKTAEERYQSALGIQEDLETCAAAWRASGRVPAFALGQRDTSDRFVIAQRLYGREPDVAALVGAFERSVHGPASLTVVAGYSGIGKTALIRELYAPIVRERAHFVSGKFDQVARNVPYGAFIEAFRDLFQQLCAESDDQVALWRVRLADALGSNGGVIAEVVPEIEFILGPQAAPAPLGPAETRNRFRLVFQRFISALARREHPLVVFLDDLQWADAATFDLLESLLIGVDLESLVLIGAFRDNEIDAAHPLSRTMRVLADAGGRLTQITLGPLGRDDLVALVGDTLKGTADEVAPLAGLIQRKTDGNPFFVIQFLKTLWRDGLVAFDERQRRWTYDLDRIAGAGITDNVIDLMTHRIQRLADDSQRALTLAACIGNRFDITTLATVCEQPVETTAAHLRIPLEEGLVLLTSASGASNEPTGYEFLHDRVQQAAYALIPEDQKRQVHLTVGRLLSAAYGPDIPDDRVFEVVNHLNVGSALIRDADEKIGLARLNLVAGRKAKSSTAYAAAATYLDRAIRLMPESGWQSSYDLMMALHLEAAESHYLARGFEVAEGLFGRLLSEARTPLDKAQVFALRIVLYENLSHYREAVASGRAGLAQFGIDLPREAEAGLALEQEIALIATLLGGRRIASLVDLPIMTDPDRRMVMRILTSLWSSAYISGNPRVARLISAMLVRLSLTGGNTEESAYGYVTHAITIGPTRGDYRQAFEWGELALAVNDRFDDNKGRAKIHQQFHAHVKLWCQPFETCLIHAREAQRSGLESGDLNYAGYGAMTETWPAFLIANDLAGFVRQYEPAAGLLEKLGLADFLTALRIILNWAQALRGRTANPLSLSSADFDEDAFLARFENEPFFRTFFDTAKLHLAVLHQEVDRALLAQRRASQNRLEGTVWPVLIDFWGGLALAAAYDRAAPAEQADYDRQLTASTRSLTALADSCPENYRCFALLLSGEHQRVRGEVQGAERAYRDAMAYGRETGNVQHEALAAELCGRLVQRQSNEAAQALFGAAHRAYASWGAAAKARQLESRYSFLPSTAVVAASSERTTAAMNDSDAPLDMATVVKVANAIAAEIELDALLRTLVRIALENAGAQRGYFLREVDGQLVVEAEASADGEGILVRAPLDRVSSLARGLVHYVRNTLRSVVVADATRDDRFSADHYVMTARPRSLLCVPALRQGALAGILYLENNLATDAFTANHLKVLEILCAQAAISLENARLYDQVRRESEQRRRAEEVLREVTEGTASTTGTDFFRSLVQHLASALRVRYAFVAECRDRSRERVRTLAFWHGQAFGDNFEYDTSATPCQRVLEGRVCHFADDVQRLFPHDRDLAALEAKSYLAGPLCDAAGEVIGHLAVLDDKPMREDPWAVSVIRIFAARAGAELERVRAEHDLRGALEEVEALKNRLQDENVYLQEEIRDEHNFDEIIGSSPRLLEALRRIEQVAPTDATVLIAGETGTGKELVARAIHSRSARQGRALVKVNCGAISAGLVESELFGHVKGAFTGAIDKRVGRFELAHGGTLFLDEVSELPLETQVKLLRVLQEQEFEPVGSSRSMRVDVRIIAASNRNLDEAVQAGRFRADLFFRLNVLPLQIPPLRDRRSDIPQLVTFFLSRFAKRFGKKVDAVSRESMELLSAYPWPGNVRELQNVIERAVVLSTGTVLKLDRDLLPTVPIAGPPSPDEWKVSASSGGSTLEEIQRRHILTVLEQTRGVIEGPAGAARVLNLHPNTLRSRMKKLGLGRPLSGGS